MEKRKINELVTLKTIVKLEDFIRAGGIVETGKVKIDAVNLVMIEPINVYENGNFTNPILCIGFIANLKHCVVSFNGASELRTIAVSRLEVKCETLLKAHVNTLLKDKNVKYVEQLNLF